jgi:hypothetical protein
MRRACVSSSSFMICSSRRVLYCFLLVLVAGTGAAMRRVSGVVAAGSGDSPASGSDAARRLRDEGGARGGAGELCAFPLHRG